MLAPAFLQSKFAEGLGFAGYVMSGKSHEQTNWHAAHAKVSVTPAQRSVIASFARRINVLAISGTWCGDCVQQCPMLERIAEANRAGKGVEDAGIDLRFVDRDKHIDLSDKVRICGGLRVPTVIFMNEEFEFVSILGDRTLARYRAVAARSLGPSCPMPGAEMPADEAAATVADWVNEFERVALLLRLSPKLREKHGD